MIDTEALCTTQRELSELVAPPGREEPVREYLRREIADYVDELRLDGAGNLLAVRNGTEGGARILLDAHMDEVGFMVSFVHTDGFLRIAPLGGVDPLLMSGTPLQFIAADGSTVYGVCTSIPPHLARSSGDARIPAMDELTVDVGAASAAEVSAMGLGVGSVGTFDVQFRRIGEHALLGKAFDDRSGCTMLLHLARLFAEQAPRNQLLFNFSCGEEVPGHRGARIAARNEAADLVIVLENTTATDTPGVPEHKVITRAGAGPALTLADKSHIAPEALVTRLTALADAEGIPWQYKMPVYGSTNAGELSWTAGGVPTGVISVPCRYIHAPAGLIRIDDLLHSLSLVHRICNEPLQ